MCLPCRALLLTGDFFLGGVLAGALTKLLLQLLLKLDYMNSC